MSLLTNWGPHNMVTEEALCVRYSQAFNNEQSYWEVTRLATKQYRFIGMTEATAKACVSAKLAQYTRNYTQIIEREIPASPGSDTMITVHVPIAVPECMADIVAVREGDGNAWSVQIAVSEVDMRPYQFRNVGTNEFWQPCADPASLFPEANARDYDDDEGDPGPAGAALRITSATRGNPDSIDFNWTTSLPSVTTADLSAEYSTAAGVWIPVEVVPSQSYDDFGSVLDVPTDYDLTFRISYGNFVSNSVVIEKA